MVNCARICMWCAFLIGCIAMAIGSELSIPYMLEISPNLCFFLPCLLRYADYHASLSYLQRSLISCLLTAACTCLTIFFHPQYTVLFWLIFNRYILMPAHASSFMREILFVYIMGFFIITCISTVLIIILSLVMEFESLPYIILPVLINSLAVLSIFARIASEELLELSGINFGLVGALATYFVKTIWWTSMWPAVVYVFMFVVSCGWVIHDINSFFKKRIRRLIE